MSDNVTAKSSGVSFTPHPAGQFVAQAVDVIDLGERVDDGKSFGNPPSLQRKCVIMFRTGETNELGKLTDIGQEFTVSMNEKANLRKFLESWRGEKYSESQVMEGVPLHKLTGYFALITTTIETSRQGRKYGKILNAVPVPKAMRSVLPTFPVYEREEYWEKKKEEYAAGARQFKNEQGSAPSNEEPEPEYTGDDGDSSLPF